MTNLSQDMRFPPMWHFYKCLIIIAIKNIVNTFIYFILGQNLFLVPQIVLKSTHNEFDVMGMGNTLTLYYIEKWQVIIFIVFLLDCVCKL